MTLASWKTEPPTKLQIIWYNFFTLPNQQYCPLVHGYKATKMPWRKNLFFLSIDFFSSLFRFLSWRSERNENAKFKIWKVHNQHIPKITHVRTNENVVCIFRSAVSLLFSYALLPRALLVRCFAYFDFTSHACWSLLSSKCYCLQIGECHFW